jgi:hypothetical protein
MTISQQVVRVVPRDHDDLIRVLGTDHQDHQDQGFSLFSRTWVRASYARVRACEGLLLLVRGPAGRTS